MSCPETPHDQEPTSFFNLPLEIRSQIYAYLLVSRTPLIAWAGVTGAELSSNWENTQGCSYRCISRLSLPSYLTHAIPVERTFRPLLLCSRQLTHEIARVFYSQNVFRFIGEHDWDAVAGWLRGIGTENRRFLTSLEFSMARPQHVWQLPDGARAQLGKSFLHLHIAEAENKRERVYPLNRHLALDLNADLEGIVENVSPAVESVFALLAESACTLMMLLPRDLLPGVRIRGEPEKLLWFEMGMDLPNVMARCSEIHDLEGRVDVLWKGEVCLKGWRMMIEEVRERMEERGWEMLTREHPVLKFYHSVDRLLHEHLDELNMLFTLRRKAIGGVAVADGPLRSSQHYCRGPTIHTV